MLKAFESIDVCNEVGPVVATICYRFLVFAFFVGSEQVGIVFFGTSETDNDLQERGTPSA